MTYLKAILLGLVQGIAEFLPISSSGHLAIARNLLNMEGAGSIPEFFDVLLHLGTLIAVFAAYWSDIRDMVVEFFRGIGDLAHRSTPTPVPPARRLILLIVVGTLAAVCGAAHPQDSAGLGRQYVFRGRGADLHRLPAVPVRPGGAGAARPSAAPPGWTLCWWAWGRRWPRCPASPVPA